jgi:hypothetical protein
MIQVIFKDKVDSPHSAAKGTLDIPESDNIGRYKGCVLPFTITSYSDLPFRAHGTNEGVVAEVESRKYYKFQIVEMDEKASSERRTGRLRILSEAKR